MGNAGNRVMLRGTGEGFPDGVVLRRTVRGLWTPDVPGIAESSLGMPSRWFWLPEGCDYDGDEPCQWCGGSGQREPTGPVAEWGWEYARCLVCNGSGRVIGGRDQTAAANLAVAMIETWLGARRLEQARRAERVAGKRGAGTLHVVPGDTVHVVPPPGPRPAKRVTSLPRRANDLRIL